MFAGDTVMKRRGGLEVVCKPRSEAAFRAEMQGALRSNATRPAEPPVSAVAAAAPTDLAWLEARLRQHASGRFDHRIRVEGPGETPLRIEIDLETQTAAVVEDWRLPAPYHHFRLEADPMLRWLGRTMTLEGVIGTRRFRIERVPERYDPAILAVINGAL